MTDEAQERRNPWRVAVSLIILAAFFSWAMWFIWGHRAEFTVLAKVPPWMLLGLFLLAAGTVICNGLFIKYVLEAFGAELSYGEWLPLTVVTSVLNYLLPMRGGMMARALYLKSRYHFRYVDFVCTLSAMYLIYIVVYGVIGLLGIALLWCAGLRCNAIIPLFFAAATIAACVLMFVRLRAPPWEHFALRQLAQVLEGWSTLRCKRRALWRLFLVTIAYAICTLLQVALAASAVKVSMPAGAIMVYAAGTNLALLAALTPAALGITELVSVYMGQALDYSTAEALMIQGLLRASFILLLFGSALPSLHRLSRGHSSVPPPPCDDGDHTE